MAAGLDGRNGLRWEPVGFGLFQNWHLPGCGLGSVFPLSSTHSTPTQGQGRRG